MPSQSRYVVVETLISMVINTVLSVFFVFLIFHGRTHVATLGMHGIIADMAPQTFMIALMSSLVPTLVTRQRIRTGSLGSARTSRASAGWICLTAFGVALLASALVVGVCWSLLPRLLPEGVQFGSLLLSKALYGMLLAAVVTPWAVRRVLPSASA